MSKEFAIDKYLVGALYKAKLDAENKEFEYTRNGMRIPVEDYRRILYIVLEQCKADGCTGCAFINTEEWEEPCRRCARNCKDYWRAGEKKWQNKKSLDSLNP